MFIYFHYINAIGFAFSIYCFVIVLSRGERILPMAFLLLSNLFLILTSVLYFSFLTGSIINFPYFIRVPATFHYLIGPCIFLFVRTLLYREKKLKPSDWLHFIPFIIHFFELLPFHLQNTEFKLKVVAAIQKNYFIPFTNLNEGLLPSRVHTVLKLISWSTYIFLSTKTLIHFKKNIKSKIITDYNRKFQFLDYFLFTKYIGIVAFISAIYLIRFNQSLLIITQIANLFGISNVFLLVFKFPDLIYGDKLYTTPDNNREQLINIVMTQTENLKLLENSKFEGTILLDANYKLVYFNKLAEEKFFHLYNQKLALNEDFTSFLDPVSKSNFLSYFEQCLNRRTLQVEEKFMLFDNSDFTWLLLSFTAHHDSEGKLISVSVCGTEIDQIKKMEQLQEKYLHQLDQLAWKSAHLLRAPVANVMGILNILEDKQLTIYEEEKEFLLSNIKSEMAQLDNTIREMVVNAREQVEI